jgi:putative addiction module component (TIGR02574 family)
MTTTVLRKKVIEYVNHAEPNVLEAVYKILQAIEGDDSISTLTKKQKEELERRSALYRAGELKTYSWTEVKKSLKNARK